jgi:hypothetical protein
MSEHVAPEEFKQEFKQNSAGHVHVGDETSMKFYHDYATTSGKTPQVIAIRPPKGLKLHPDPDNVEGKGYRTTQNIKPKHLVHLTNNQFNDISKGFPTLSPHRADFARDLTARNNLVHKHTTPKPRGQFGANVRRGLRAVIPRRGRHR